MGPERNPELEAPGGSIESRELDRAWREAEGGTEMVRISDEARSEAYELGHKAGTAARQGDWSRVKHWQRWAPRVSDPAYGDYKAGYADAQVNRYRQALTDEAARSKPRKEGEQ